MELVGSRLPTIATRMTKLSSRLRREGSCRRAKASIAWPVCCSASFGLEIDDVLPSASLFLPSLLPVAVRCLLPDDSSIPLPAQAGLYSRLDCGVASAVGGRARGPESLGGPRKAPRI